MKSMKLKVLCSLALFVLVMAGFWLSVSNPVKVEAQGTGQNTFSIAFSLPASTSVQYIPACTATVTTGCIPNFNQVGHSVIVTSKGVGLGCEVLIDGSENNTNFNTIAALEPYSDSSGAANLRGLASANGYFPYTRLKVFACTVGMSITYIGYGSQLPILPASTSFIQNIAAITQIRTVLGGGSGNAILTPMVLEGFECSNPDSATAYLQLWAATGTPTLGTGYQYQVAIPGNSVFTYSGPPINLFSLNPNVAHQLYFYGGASTAAGGSTAVSTSLNCNFQINPAGPYYPFNPPSS